MKTRGTSFYALLLGVAVAIPVVGHTVTLPTASRTPCFFGALGSSTACSPMGDTSEGATMARDRPTALTPQVATNAGATEVAVSAVVAPEVVAEATSDLGSVASVPLPLAGGLLFGSLGFMVFAVRKKSK